MSAITFPTISVGEGANARTLTVRFSIAAQLLMVRRGIDPTKLLEFIGPENPRKADNILTIFSACVAENVLDISCPERLDLNAAPTGDYWATQLDALQFPEVERTLAESMGKVTEARKLRLVPPPKAEEATAQAS